jgi:phosphate transport system substrate-binding protein
MKHSHHALRRFITAAGATFLCLALLAGIAIPQSVSAGPMAATVKIVGAGSTFDYPFFNLAFAVYGKSHPVSVNYQAIGSGGGIQQFTNNTVDFGATDVPMSADELKMAEAKGSAVVQLPIALGGVAIAYNLPGMKGVLKLNGSTLAQMFMGKITTWNDPAIAKLNPGLTLPSTAILPVHRSDASGTNYITTDYLSSVSSDWANNIGKGKSVAWPTGVGGKGNPGVAAAIKQHSGAIGYVELAYALDNHIPYAEMQNKAGAYLSPSQNSVRAAAAQFPNVSYKNFSIVNAPGKKSYPIAGYSWVLLRQHPKSNGTQLVDLFMWMTTGGQQYAVKLYYVALPANVQKEAAKALASIH